MLFFSVILYWLFCFIVTLTHHNVRFMPNLCTLGDLENEDSYVEYNALLKSCQYNTIDTFNHGFYNTTQLLILHINVRSLQKNFDAFEGLVKSMKTKPHIILISETWLNPALSKSYTLDNYRLEVSCQPDFRGKGVAAYIDASLPYSRRRDLESDSQQHQSIFIELKCASTRHCVMGAMYRSPSFAAITFLDYLERVLEYVNGENKFCLIGGDFNFDILKHSSDDGCSNFVNLLASLGFFPCISVRTRITSHSSTLIDNFFVITPHLLIHHVC